LTLVDSDAAHSETGLLALAVHSRADCFAREVREVRDVPVAVIGLTILILFTTLPFYCKKSAIFFRKLL